MNIELIASDIDGTLLHKHEKTPDLQVFNMIGKASKSKTKFALASGRSYNDICRIFGFYKNFYYICSDGSYIVKNDNIIYRKAIDNLILTNILNKLNGSSFVLYGKDYAYVSDDIAKDAISDIENKLVKPLEMFYNEEIFKISVYKPNTYATHYIEINQILRKCYMDSCWTEYVCNDADKGDALKHIQCLHGISYEKTAAFGDNINDISMLKNAYYSYAVNGAKAEIKALARFYTDNPSREIIDKFFEGGCL